jgi:hypothetical protein
MAVNINPNAAAGTYSGDVITVWEWGTIGPVTLTIPISVVV